MAATAGRPRFGARPCCRQHPKQNAIIRLGMRGVTVAPMWEGVSLIPDEITKAAEGQIRITGVMLHAVKVLREAGMFKQQTQHA